MISIAVDAMGGDFGPAVTLPASLAFLAEHEGAALEIVGQLEVLQGHPQFAQLQANTRCKFIHAAEIVTMDDPIEIALRRKKNSSMRLAINQVKDGSAQAAVSAGNTGALMAIARYVLKTMDGIEIGRASCRERV